jgi:hypothetical protein
MLLVTGIALVDVVPGAFLLSTPRKRVSYDVKPRETITTMLLLKYPALLNNVARKARAIVVWVYLAPRLFVVIPMGRDLSRYPRYTVQTLRRLPEAAPTPAVMLRRWTECAFGAVCD